MNNKTFRNAIAAQCGFNKAKQLTWPDHDTISTCAICGKTRPLSEPCYCDSLTLGVEQSFEDWLKSNGDSIETPLDRTEATCQWFDNKAKDEHPFA